MGISATFSEPFYQGPSVSSGTPFYLPVSIGSHQYLMDLSKYQRQTISPIRPPQDNSQEPGEQSLSQEGLWRRSQSSWHMGAGQEYFDDAESIRQRFESSKGLDIWTRRRLRLLPDTVQRRASTETNLQVLQVGTRLYFSDGIGVQHVADPTLAWSGGNIGNSNIHAGEGAQPVLSLTTDGATVWAALGTNGVHKTVAGDTSSNSVTTSTMSVVGYVNGRLLGAHLNSVWEISRAGVLTLIRTHPNPDFVWTAIAQAPNAAYLVGTCADRSEIYAVSTLDATGALSPPILSTTLPDGEVVRAITYYGGAMLLGTSRGLRLAVIGSNHYLNYGPVIELRDGSGNLVGTRAFEGQGEFVWFGWDNYDTISTGLGRVNLSEFTAELVPAYASDLMVTDQGEITSIATVGGRRYFTISGVGFYGEGTDLVPSGQLETGRVTYGTVEKKIVTSFDMRHAPLPVGSYVVANTISEEGNSAQTGRSQIPGSLSPQSPLSIDQEKTEAIQLSLTLARDIARTVTDAETTNNSQTLTSATAAFVSGDTGKLLTGAGIPAGTTIAIVVSATQVTMSDRATATATGVSLVIGDNTVGPELVRWTLYSRVTPVLSDEIICPLIIHSEVLSNLGEGAAIYYNTLAEYEYLQSLANDKSIQRYQEGSTSYNVYVSQLKLEPKDWTYDRSFFEGIIYARLVTVST